MYVLERPPGAGATSGEVAFPPGMAPDDATQEFLR